MAQPFLAQSAVLRIGAFDDKAELREFEPTALKLTLTIARRLCWWLNGMQRLELKNSGGFMAAQLQGLTGKPIVVIGGQQRANFSSSFPYVA